MNRAIVSAIAALFAVGCGSKDNISLSAALSNVSLTVTEQALGTQLSGGFDLYLEVGGQADGTATVELGNFSIKRDSATLVDGVQVLPQGVSFPLKLGKGDKKTVPFDLDDSALLPASDKANLCSGPVQLVGAVTHDLNGGETTPVQGPAAVPSGC